MAADFRAAFFDTIKELCDVLDETHPYDQVVWKVEYLTRGTRWYHYYGMSRGQQSASIGHVYEVETGSARPADPATLIFTLLDFAANRQIAAYSGRRTVATDILEDVEETVEAVPEIVRLSIERRRSVPCRRRIVSITDMAFVGVLEAPAVDASRPLARDRDFLSPKWCRDHHFIEGTDTPPRLGRGYFARIGGSRL